MMLFTITPIIICIISLVLIRHAHMDRHGPLVSLGEPPGLNQETEIEDEIDYSQFPLNSGTFQEYDWSPPNGEMPDNKKGGSLYDYLNTNTIDQDSKEDRLDQEAGLLLDTPKQELKRGFDLPRKKKNQVLCRVQKAVHRHNEIGHEFFPKSYTSYSCHPVTPSWRDESLSNSYDTCYIAGDNCITIEKEQLFLKRSYNTNCWTHFIEAVGAGCKCLSRKY